MALGLTADVVEDESGDPRCLQPLQGNTSSNIVMLQMDTFTPICTNVWIWLQVQDDFLNISVHVALAQCSTLSCSALK